MAYKFLNQQHDKIMDKKRFALLVVAITLPLAVGWAVWNGYKSLSDQLASVKSEVTFMKSALGGPEDFVPPLYGSRHVALRKRFALDQISQADGDFFLIIGDSIVEGMNSQSLAGVQVINAGMGGGRLKDAREFLSDIQPGSAIKGVLIAIGVNDAVKGVTAPEPLDKWSDSLKSAISRAKALAGNNVAISTVIPVEKGKPLGDEYFDIKKILEINRLIRQVCAETKTTVVDQEPSFSALANSGVEYTTDGVHLNGEGYRLMKNNIRKAIRW